MGGKGEVRHSHGGTWECFNFVVSYPENGGVLTERLKCSMVMGGFAGN